GAPGRCRACRAPRSPGPTARIPDGFARRQRREQLTSRPAPMCTPAISDSMPLSSSQLSRSAPPGRLPLRHGIANAHLKEAPHDVVVADKPPDDGRVFVEQIVDVEIDLQVLAVGL